MIPPSLNKNYNQKACDVNLFKMGIVVVVMVITESGVHTLYQWRFYIYFKRPEP